MTPKITPVILSGGSGTRLWPLSRTGRPKQLLNLVGSRTMLQLTALRTDDREEFEQGIVVASADHAVAIEEQLADVRLHPMLILEPLARNTAPAIALAAFAAAPDALLLVMPSDHVIADVAAFRRAVHAAAGPAAEGWLVTFGITPDTPDTGYGYIRVGEELAPGACEAETFVEKPDRTKAEQYLTEGCWAWNGGIFLFRAESYIAALDASAPAIAAACRAATAAARTEGTRLYPDAQAFAASPAESIDYAVMEKAERVAVVPVAMGWSDVGSWDALHDLAPKDDSGNAHQGDVVAIDTSDCLIRTDGPLVAAVGVTDLIVIATGDAVLILPRGSSQEVKRAVALLQGKGHVALDRPAPE